MCYEIPQTTKNWDLKENFFLRGYNPGFLRAYIHHFKGRLGSEKAIYFPQRQSAVTVKFAEDGEAGKGKYQVCQRWQSGRKGTTRFARDNKSEGMGTLDLTKTIKLGKERPLKMGARMAINENCPCKRKKCERHGKCDECRKHHAESERQRPVYCEKKKKE